MTHLQNAPTLCSLTDELAANIASSGGKSAGLHKLFAAGLPVPPGFVITTSAFRDVIGQNAGFQDALAHLNDCAEGSALREGAEGVRNAVLACDLPPQFARDVVDAWKTLTKSASVAVRSSATAEDLAGASFAGQQDTYLEIDNEPALLLALRKCWASLFTERAVVYRRAHGFDNARVSMAVVIQQMVHADAAGVLFTADPLNGHRGISVIEAVAGLGEALVGGHVTPERYRIRTHDGEVLERRSSQGQPLSATEGLLSTGALEQLCKLGKEARDRANEPLDIEWAMEKNRLWLLQARPITTLFPLPEGESLPGWRVFVSFGHMQVNLAPLSRIATSIIRRAAPLRRDKQTGLSTLVRVAGDRIYIDVTPALARQPFNKLLPRALNVASEPIARRLEAAAKREELQTLSESERASLAQLGPDIFGVLRRATRAMLNDPHAERNAYLEELEQITLFRRRGFDDTKSLREKIDLLFVEIDALADRVFGPMFHRMLPQVVLSKVLPNLTEWFAPGMDHRAFLQGLDGNITTEMDMVLADLADLARETPALVSALQTPEPLNHLNALRNDPTCSSFFQAWDDFLERFGHRCAGEIDPAVPRWREDPRIPLRSIAGALERPKGALREQHQTLAYRAMECQEKLVASAENKLFGFAAAPLTSGLINRMRTMLGVREQHKFVVVKFIDCVRTVVLECGDVLHRTGALASADDIWHLELDEVRNAIADVESGRTIALQDLVAQRRALRDQYAHMTPPAVMTSDGESLAGVVQNDIPTHTLAGTAVSSGIYEGIARVVHDPVKEDLGAGEILVAQFTDPGWTPLFGHAGALVMEVGGQMTHGSVIAREIGIPAVVAVEGATTKIKSGNRIRVDGDRGWVTLLEGGKS